MKLISCICDLIFTTAILFSNCDFISQNGAFFLHNCTFLSPKKKLSQKCWEIFIPCVKKKILFGLKWAEHYRERQRFNDCVPDLCGLYPVRSFPTTEGTLYAWRHHHHNDLWSWLAWVWGSSSGAKLGLHWTCKGSHYASNRHTWCFFRLCPLQPARRPHPGRRTVYSEALLCRRAADSLGASRSSRVHWTGPSAPLHHPRDPDI